MAQIYIHAKRIAELSVATRQMEIDTSNNICSIPYIQVAMATGTFSVFIDRHFQLLSVD
jgi:hypothetical protein